MGKRSPNFGLNHEEGDGVEVVRGITFTVYINTNERVIEKKCHNINEFLVLMGDYQDQGLLDRPRVSTKRFTGRCQEAYDPSRDG